MWSFWIDLSLLEAKPRAPLLEGMTEKAIWHIVKDSAKTVGIAKLAPHDLRRTCARLCHASGGELEQIQFLLGHLSVQTTECYLDCNSGFAQRKRSYRD
jgi:site-specific recombinase XerD